MSNVMADADGVTVTANETYHATMTTIATGANTTLLNSIDLKPSKPNMVAARVYLEGVDSLPLHFQFRFDGVVLPGYGWVFPLSASSANVGAGFIRTGNRQLVQPAQTAFNNFIQSLALKKLLSRAQQIGPLKSFPIRTDFASASIFAERVLLVGEAVGLVNPLTGDGIE